MKRRKSRKTGELLMQHLEDLSWRVLEEYRSLIRELIRGRHGVYALYRKGALYYVGLASNLMGRLNSHLRDRHRGAWDRFSVYLTLSSAHMKELESLLIRIVSPAGNRAGGRFATSESLFSGFSRRMRELDADRRAMFLGGAVAARRRRLKATRATGAAALAGFAERRLPLHARYRGVTYRAILRPDGRIRFKGRVYPSPSAAGTAVIKRPCNGWTFWHYRNDERKWVPLESLRK